ncbi:hypothetical protein CDD83_2373 [Cordyceps sp. RAO-2017]|nr:hypothetical protein CDD83_2373 [Cordyceps sp. RAO-2017]
MPLKRRPAKITIHTGGESSRSTSYNSEEDSSQHDQDYSPVDGEWEDDEPEYYEDEEVNPSDSASASNEVPPSRPPTAARSTPRHHRQSRQETPYPSVREPAPNPPSLDPSEEFSGHYGHAFQPHPAHRGGGGYYGGRGNAHLYSQNHGNHYMAGYPGGNQMVPYGNYGPNPFTPMSNNNSSGASYFGGGEQRHMYDMMPYQPGAFYGAPQYNLPAHMQQFHLSPPPPPATEAPAQPASPAPPKEPPVDIEKIKLEAQIAALKAQEDKQKALDEQRERDAQIRKETEESIFRKMEEMKKAQEEAQKEIARAKADADAAAVARLAAERQAAEERLRQEADAIQRAEEKAIKKYEADQKAAEEQRKREQEERVRIEEAARARYEAAMKAEAEAKAAAEKRAAEEAEKLKQLQEEARRKAEAEVLAKVEAEKEAAKKAAEAEAAAKKEQELLKKRIQDEAKAKFEEAAKKSEKGPIKFKDAVGRKFSFPFHLCNTWQGMEELIKQAFLHVDVIGPHVQEGHYDLIGPNGDIILPSVWEKTVEPEWSISMTMWPVEKMPPLGPKMPPPPRGRGQGPGMPPPPPMAGIPMPRPGMPMPPGMAPHPDWEPERRRPGHVPAGINVVNVNPPTKSSKPSKRNSAMLTFFAGKPTKKKTSKK